jgi:hypothetical protein
MLLSPERKVANGVAAPAAKQTVDNLSRALAVNLMRSFPTKFMLDRSPVDAIPRQ